MTRHVPVLRQGVVYRSLDTRTLETPRGVVEVSLANPGLVRRDGRRAAHTPLERAALQGALLRASEALFEPLMMDPDEPALDLDEFSDLVNATTGLSPEVIRHQLELLSETLRDLSARVARCEPTRIESLGVILPSNAIAVNRAWLPALVCGARVALKPGASDPFTPHRVVSALVSGGIPADNFSIYPSTHETTGALIGMWPRVQLFGDAEVVARYGEDARVQVNGPGKSAVVLGPDCDLGGYVDALAEGIVMHEGRSCLNTSSIVTLGGPERAAWLADALAERLARVPGVRLADHAKAQAVARFVSERLLEPGARRASVPAICVQGPGGELRLGPTVVHCERHDHPLARVELPFAFVSVTALQASELIEWLGTTLSVATLGADDATVASLRQASAIERLCPKAPHSLETSMASLHLERMQRLLS